MMCYRCRNKVRYIVAVEDSWIHVCGQHLPTAIKKLSWVWRDGTWERRTVSVLWSGPRN